MGPRVGLDTVWSREKSLALVENRIPAFQPVAHRYTE
jgi:hypothetical protein